MVLNNRYSQHARRALSQARLLAQDYQHAAVDTDHLLVGILRERGSLGAQVLLDLEVDSHRAETEMRLLHGRATSPITPLDLTEALHRALHLSAEESRWFGHHYIGTEHLLLALARSREGGAPALMRILLITPDQIRRRVRRLLQDGMTELSIEAAKRTARLSELSRRVLNAAEQLAAQQEDQPAGLDHLLLVLAGEKRSPVSRILRDSGLNRETLQARLGQFKVEDPLNPQDLLEDVIDHAVDRADQLGTHYTGTDHILLALAENPHGARLLQQAGVNREQLIAAIYRDLRLPR
jgi:ATP-dependent Clp protease ATP-binding subunit ClpA